MGYINGKRIFMSPKVIIGSTDGVTTTLEISEDGYWVIGGVKTEHLAVGQDGATPYIGDDGYWYIDGNNIGVKASGTDGVGISDISLFETNGNKDTYRITLTNGNTSEFTVTNGTKGEKGDPGVPFKVTKTYASIDAMNKDYSNTSVEEGSFVMIDTGNVNDADNAKLFIKGATAFVYIVDLSGSSGIKGDDGKSAYKLAQETGFEGSLSDWLSSLVGANGKTPYIQDGYWYIDGVNLNVKAAGVDGTSITSIDFVESNSISGVTKHTYRIRLSNGTYTDFVVRDGAQGKRGERGATPTIGVDGYWYIDGENTNVKAEGADGRDGKNGYTPQKGTDYFDGVDGKDGKDGYTPVRGVDYFTEADKSAMVVAVMEAIGTPLFGLVDENNTVILTGKLGDGSYNIKYEMADGSTVDIGSLVLDTNVYYSVTKSLSYCTINNSATSVIKGEPYSATITANDGYELKSVKVTMGGTDITSSAVSGGNISILSVTGKIVITAVAEEKASGIINQIPISTDANGNLFVGTNGEKGYKTDTRISGSSGGESSATGVEATGFIPIKFGDTMYLKGIVDDGTHVVCFYNSARAKIVSWGWSTEFPNGLDGSIATFILGYGNFAGSGVENTAFVRLSANEITDSSIITINQPLE